MKTQKEINQEIKELTESEWTKRINSRILNLRQIKLYLESNSSEAFLKTDLEKLNSILRKRRGEFNERFAKCSLVGKDLSKLKAKVKTELEIPFLEKRVKTLKYILS